MNCLAAKEKRATPGERARKFATSLDGKQGKNGPVKNGPGKGPGRVESRTGAVTLVSRWIVDSAFASSPQSGLAWFCFLFPLIEPDRRISRIKCA